MVDFAQTVAVPSTRDYAPPTPDIFAQVANLPNAYYQGRFNKQQETRNDQQKQLNDQAIRQGQIKQDIAETFRGGLPLNKDGSVDYSQAVAMLAKKGDINALWNGADATYAQSAARLSPLLSGGGQPTPAAGAPAAPANAPPRTPVQSGVQGDSGAGTIASLVTDRMPNQDTSTGQTIAKIASVMGIDPNANLTPGQMRRVQGLLQNPKYAAADTPSQAQSAPVGGGAAPATASQRVAGAFAALPPSANAGTPAATPAQGQQGQGTPPVAPAPQVAQQPAPQQPQQVAQAAPQPQAQPQAGQPIVPQVPLPKGFTDPQAAILALRAEAARISANPRAQGQVQELNNWASRIEESIKPVKMGQYDTYVDPRNGNRVVAEGPGAAMIRATESAGNSPTLDADAERYRQTGQLPPGMGRGVQGAAEARAIRARATDIEIANGGDPATWPGRWQDFKASGVGKSAGERVKANREENLNLILKAADAAIPAALEASRALPRGSYVPLNKLIQKGEIMSSDPRLVEFGMANLQLAEHWARAMNPTGVMRESDRDKALSFLDTAYGNNTYERAVMQLQKQITRERDAVRGGGTILKDNKAPAPGDNGSSGSVSKDGWTVVTGPNGKKARIQEVTE